MDLLKSKLIFKKNVEFLKIGNTCKLFVNQFSNICVKADSVEIGRKFVESVISPPLSTGVIFDILRRFGIIPCENDKLKSLIKGSLIELQANLMHLGGVPIKDNHSYSASTIINLSMVGCRLLTVCCQCFTHQPIVFFLSEASAYFIGSGCAGSLSFFFSGCCPCSLRLAASPLTVRHPLTCVAN